MKNQLVSLFPFKNTLSVKHTLFLCQFFLIIFVYHTLKDLKDTLVVTSGDAGAEVIPFIKIWVILPFSVLASYLFLKAYSIFGKEKTFYIFVSFLLVFYALFALFLYPNKEFLHLDSLAYFLRETLPGGLKGFISMVRYWSYTAFYLSAELWSMMILSVLFWGQLNDANTSEEAKGFYPLCILVGNCAGILSGQISRYFCHKLTLYIPWENVFMLVIFLVVFAGGAIMLINREINKRVLKKESAPKEKSNPLTFKESVNIIFESRKLLCIAVLVVGYSLTNNLIEVIWKGTIKDVYPAPHSYNAYINQLTSIIGFLAVVVSFFSRQLFRAFDWRAMTLVTPVVLFCTSLFFFASLLIPEKLLGSVSYFFHTSPYYFIMTLGSIHYILALTSKYTLFDTCKEMAFLSIRAEERMRAKSVIDSVGSRLGKSGASCLYQVLLILFGSTAGNIPTVAVATLLIIAISVQASRTLKKESKDAYLLPNV